MNGTSIATHFLSKLIQWLFRRAGINILLLIGLVIEVICMYGYCQDRSYEADTYRNHAFQMVGEPELVHAIDIQPGASYSNDDCYKVMIQIDNLYVKPSASYPSFYASETESFFCTLDPFEYYSDIDSYDILTAKTYFPAGTRVTFPYYVSSLQLEGTTHSFVSSDTFYNQSSYSHGDDNKNTLTITFP